MEPANYADNRTIRIELVMVSILILTKNEETDLPGCLELVSWSDDIHVYDSYSVDNTLAIAERFGGLIEAAVELNAIYLNDFGIQ